MYEILLVGVGGFLGSIFRYGVSRFVSTYSAYPFPLSTLIVNVAGSFAIGVLYEYFAKHPSLPTIAAFGGIGIIGGFTTFSAFSFETLELLRGNSASLALLNIFGNLVLGLAAVAAGAWVGHTFR